MHDGPYCEVEGMMRQGLGCFSRLGRRKNWVGYDSKNPKLAGPGLLGPR
ncbi:MAG: hypothetical protein V7642_1410 [Burkholderiales bacterium]|jgi:hypothetical protein